MTAQRVRVSHHGFHAPDLDTIEDACAPLEESA
jgi:hypothetical protein